MPKATKVERLWARIAKQPNGCWHWTGGLSPEGYGPHRRVYELLVEPIPEGLHLDHLCRVRHCVNPAHLEAVTPSENSKRAAVVRAANPTPRPEYDPIGASDLTIETGDPVGAVEIAERLGVKRATVDQWRARGGFPPVRWLVGNRPAWDWADIEAWGRSTGRL